MRILPPLKKHTTELKLFLCVQRQREQLYRDCQTQKQVLALFVPNLFPLKPWVCDIPDAEEKCQALCVFLELLFEHKDAVPSNLLSNLQQELRNAWNSMSGFWLVEEIDIGFKITSWMADCFPDISREFLTQTEEARKVIILDCPDTANTYFLCVQLAIRRTLFGC